MRKFFKKYGMIGGTAAACVACCSAPFLITPILAWVGGAGIGSILSPWFLLILIIPAGILFFQRKGKRIDGSPPDKVGC